MSLTSISNPTINQQYMLSFYIISANQVRVRSDRCQGDDGGRGATPHSTGTQGSLRTQCTHRKVWKKEGILYIVLYILYNDCVSIKCGLLKVSMMINVYLENRPRH